MYHLKKVRNTDWNNPNHIRAGFIPICFQGGMLFFGLAVDSRNNVLTDFGGHKENFDMDLLDTALREYKEESYEIFGTLSRDSVQNFEVLEGEDTVEILLPVHEPFYHYSSLFAETVKDKKDNESSKIVWLSRRQLLIALESQDDKIWKMYHRIKTTFDLNRNLI